MENKPELPDCLAMYVQAYSLLAAQRERSSDGEKPIPLSEIICLASELEIDDRDEFMKLMCLMDKTHRQYNTKNRNGRQNQNN